MAVTTGEGNRTSTAPPTVKRATSAANKVVVKATKPKVAPKAATHAAVGRPGTGSAAFQALTPAKFDPPQGHTLPAVGPATPQGLSSHASPESHRPAPQGVHTNLSNANIPGIGDHLGGDLSKVPLTVRSDTRLPAAHAAKSKPATIPARPALAGATHKRGVPVKTAPPKPTKAKSKAKPAPKHAGVPTVTKGASDHPTSSPAPGLLVSSGGGGLLDGIGSLLPLLLIAGAGLALYWLYTHRKR